MLSCPITHRQLGAACDKIQKNGIGAHREAMTRYEKDLLSEIEGLPESVQAKLLKVVHFFRAEVVTDRQGERQATKEMLSACGQWEDDRTADQQVDEIYSSRKSSNRTEAASIRNSIIS
jgi:hypothetical protein